MNETYLKKHDPLVLQFGKVTYFAFTCYFILKIIGITADNNWHYLNTHYGYWFLFEIIGFVALSCFLYAVGARDKNLNLIKCTSLWTVLDIIVSLIVFNW